MTADMQPLPRGRHRLAREDVVRSQRTRIVPAMAETMAERGYAGTSISAVLRRARVSRETFYELFASKEDCFMSVFEDAYAAISTALAASDAERAASARHRLSVVLERYLGALAADPAIARVFLIEIYAAGPSALERRIALQRELVDTLASLLGMSGNEDRFAVEAYVAAVSALVTNRLATGDVAGVRALHGPLMALSRRLGLDRDQRRAP